MKTAYWVFLLAVFQIVAVRVRADEIKQADYPVEYEIVSTSKTDKLVVQKVCSMTLRDRANAGVTLNVARTGYGTCHVLEPGKVYNGRPNEKKNRIELVIPIGQDKARVENWRITGTTTEISQSK